MIIKLQIVFNWWCLLASLVQKVDVLRMEKLAKSDLSKLTKAEREALEELYEGNGLKELIKGGRNSIGVVLVGENLSNVTRMMHGRQGNVGVVPKEIADKMRGKQFSSFDAFREDFEKRISA